ncbi:hypothetical protein [Streptomyces hyaluromycini]|uniref:hypothetical protein n=1 Tax=Streptomyces hyaluromycini TaxID=1377993 RepID=UPI00142E553E|nr:hypothetical protein [Streptomyces hyaluromycini]
MHQLAQSAVLAIGTLAHARTIARWVRDRSRERLHRSVLRELARTGGTVREEHRGRGGTVLIWELQLPERRVEPERSPMAARTAARTHRPRRRRCTAVPAAGRSSRTGGAGGGQ